MTRISERQFVAARAGTALDVEDASRDPALSSTDVASADLDGDGGVAGADEARALFAAIDADDRDGSARTIAVEARRAALEAVARRTDSDALMERLRPANDDVAFVGLNPSAATEMAAVGRRARVVPLGSSAFDETAVRIDGRLHDLTNAADIRSFVSTLGLERERAERVVAAIEHADHAGRDDLARIAAAWAPAERGATIPSRLVLSGHASGTGVHGTGGTVSNAALGRLAAAMPNAATQIEDLAVSACWSGAERKVEQWRSVFPRLQTLFGYDGAAPSQGGAARHLVLWERATRGRADRLPRTIAAGTRRGDQVATWSARGGWEGSAPPRPLDQLRGEWRWQRSTVDRFLRGVVEVDDPHEGPLRAAYTSLMHLFGRPELDADEHAALDAERAVLIRLLFYRDAIAPRFAAHCAREIDAGYGVLGARPPDFAHLGRGDALRAIASFEERVAAMQQPPEAAVHLSALLDNGLGALSSELIPDSWI